MWDRLISLPGEGWYRLNRRVFALYFQRTFGFRVEGREQEPRPPYIITANHCSAVDIPLVAIAVRAHVYFAAKVELGQHSAVKFWIRSLGSFFVRRGQVDRRAIRTGLEMLHRGRVLGVFAEGTRSPDGHLLPFEEGAAYWALKTGAPVLPIGIAGSHHTMPVGAKKAERHPVLVRIGAAIAVPRVEGRLRAETVQRWTRRFEEAVASLLPPEQQPLRVSPPVALT
jgi:1-acyl-sn-glycerol-3-phosphate acyltransferase